MKQRILIVDDDPMIRNLVRSILEAEGFDVIEADDGSKGIEILDAEPRPINISLVVLDVVMPKLNGLDTLNRLKLHPHTANLPVLMLTGEDKAEDIMAGYTVGADYYITKPFSPAELQARVEALRQRCRIDAILLTRSEEGMTLFDDQGMLHVSAQAREVFDVTGAGDTVIATLAAFVAAGLSLRDALPLANRAAGLVVAKFGTATVSFEEMFP